MSLENNNKIDLYLEEVCIHVKNKDVHDEVSSEIKEHILEICYDYLDIGYSEDESINKALERMGSTREIGSKLNKVHKAKPDFISLSLIVAIITIGVFTLYSIVSNEAYSSLVSKNILIKNLIASVAGIGIAYRIYNWNYRNLEKYSYHMYCFACMLVISNYFLGRPINGEGYLSLGGSSLSITLITNFIFIISTVGIIKNIKLNNKVGYFKLSLIILLPMGLYIINSQLAVGVMYFIELIIVLCFSKISLYYVGALTSGIILWGAGIMVSRPYIMFRALGFITSRGDAEGSGWIYNQISNILGNATLFGNSKSIVEFPNIETNLILVYIIHSFGWILAITLITLIVLFIIRSFKVSSKVKDSYGKNLFAGVVTVFFINFIIAILSSFSLAPIYCNLPFVSASGSEIVINIAMIGLLSSIYRRRNLIISEKNRENKGRLFESNLIKRMEAFLKKC
ncbi:cell division protein FtsW, lipid II flippase [Clostridium collagenovorans DSM 3089]|uniref:Cell division protein FtsW, lipid II flippase n=1 Tax=Clostridium collagenovorans DSM 3089 TaxID=1121306 RepID=A0A1M5WUF4_9CLOT|nr:FtsW/RodA/SpoVE family cell cycle protein [Clostridium collagenovorans]SHH90613.1 cell division protein FtsW, lipid II flippase [Clostridium collagenovorans DSM 3089]